MSTHEIPENQPVTQKRSDAPSPLSLKERRRAAQGRISGRQKRAEQTLLEDLEELSSADIEELPGADIEALSGADIEALSGAALCGRDEPARPQPATPPQAQPGSSFPPLGGGAPAGLEAPLPNSDAQVDVLEQHTETAKKLLTYDTAIDPNPMLDPPPLPGEADDTAVDVRMDADFLAELQALKARSQAATEASAAPSSEQLDTPATIWTSDFGSSPELPRLRPASRGASSQTYDEGVEPLPQTAEDGPEHTLARGRPPAPKRDTEETPSLASQVPPPRDDTPVPLRPDGAQDAPSGFTMDAKPPPTPPTPTMTTPEQERVIEHALRNRQTLEAFCEQSQSVYMHFDQAGRLSLADLETSASDQLFAFPTFDKERLLSMSVPIGFVKDDMGALCESHLVLAKARKANPIWSRAIAELQATSSKSLQFKKWLVATPDDLAHLNEIQRLQLLEPLPADLTMVPA